MGAFKRLDFIVKNWFVNQLFDDIMVIISQQIYDCQAGDPMLH